jgi:hypothetical protein
MLRSLGPFPGIDSDNASNHDTFCPIYSYNFTPALISGACWSVPENTDPHFEAPSQYFGPASDEDSTTSAEEEPASSTAGGLHFVV